MTAIYAFIAAANGCWMETVVAVSYSVIGIALKVHKFDSEFYILVFFFLFFLFFYFTVCNKISN